MLSRAVGTALALAFAMVGGAAPAAAQTTGGEDGPEVELPSGANGDATGDISVGSDTTVGGYGSVVLTSEDDEATVDLRRLVLFFGHNFNDNLRFHSEVEFEHAAEEIEIEQAFLDGLISKRLNLRGGLVLMPVGIINQYHESPSFNGVDRPDVDRYIIPSTWREPGVGIFGELADGLDYQLYVVNGLDASGFSAAGIAGSSQHAMFANAENVAGVARLDYEVVPGTVVGLSAYGGTSGNTLEGDEDEAGAEEMEVGQVPVGLVEADVRTRLGGFEARGEFAALFISDTEELSEILAAEMAAGAGGTPGTTDEEEEEEEEGGGPPVSSVSLGGYVELGYNILHTVDTEQRLTVFGRFDYVNTQLDVPQGFDKEEAFIRYSGVGGLVWRPILQVALKADYRRREFGEGPGSNEFAGAITWMF